MAELSGIGLIAIIAGAVILFLILPLICCCVLCGWCCSSCCRPRREKSGAVHIHQQQPISPTNTSTIIQNTSNHQRTLAEPTTTSYDYYNANHGYSQSQHNPQPNFSPWDNNSYPGGGGGYYNEGQQPVRNYYADQRYKPLTEFGLNRSQYPDVHPYESNHAPRNYLGQSQYDIYQQSNHRQNAYYGAGTKYDPPGQQRKY